MPQQILTLVSSLGRGGTERVASNFARAFAHAGHTSAVLAYEGGGMRRTELQAAGVDVFAVGEDGTSYEALEWAARVQPHLVHLHRVGFATPDLDPLLRTLRALPTAPVVVETNVFGKPDTSDGRFLVDIHLMLSAWQLWKWRRWTRTLRPRPVGVVVPNAVDLAPFAPAPAMARQQLRAQLGIPNEACLIGCFAQPDPVKWSRVLFEAFARVASVHPHAHLLVVGLPRALHSWIRALPPEVQTRVVSLPVVSDDVRLNELYGILDLFVNAGQMGESFGMVYAEALLCHVPVLALGVVHRGNSAPEVIGPGGYVAATPGDFTRCMLRLVSRPDERVALAQAGFEHIRTHFASSIVAEQVLQVASLARSSRGVSLEAALAAEGFRTDLSEPDRKALQERMHGTPPLWQRAARTVLHHPTFYRLWSRRS